VVLLTALTARSRPAGVAVLTVIFRVLPSVGCAGAGTLAPSPAVLTLTAVVLAGVLVKLRCAPETASTFQSAKLPDKV
jgi:hypothetical protein